jgi:hypothetical protein
MLFLAAVVWHYWIAVPLAAGSVLFVIMTIAGYVKNVSRYRYPPKDQ